MSIKLTKDGRFPTSKVRPLTEAALTTKYKKLLDAGVIDFKDGEVAFTTGGQRIITEMLIDEHIDKLTVIADGILAESKEDAPAKSKK